MRHAQSHVPYYVRQAVSCCEWSGHAMRRLSRKKLLIKAKIWDSNSVVSLRWGLGGLRQLSVAPSGLRPSRHSSRLPGRLVSYISASNGAFSTRLYYFGWSISPIQSPSPVCSSLLMFLLGLFALHAPVSCPVFSFSSSPRMRTNGCVLSLKSMRVYMLLLPLEYSRRSES